MKSRSLFILYFLLVTMMLSSCKKIFEPRLPDATQDGKNTFGCSVNGKLFYPKGGFFYPSNQIIRTDNEYKIRVQYNHEYMNLVFTPTGTGKIPFCARYSHTETSCEYEECEPVIGTLEITKYDLQNKIISGYFNFTLSAINSCPGVVVTDGRFDYKFE